MKIFEQKITNSSARVFSGTRFQTSLPCNKKYFLLPASMFIHLSLYMPIYFRSISLHTCLPSLSLYLCLFYLSRSVCLSIFYIYGSICHSLFLSLCFSFCTYISQSTVLSLSNVLQRPQRTPTVANPHSHTV